MREQVNGGGEWIVGVVVKLIAFPAMCFAFWQLFIFLWPLEAQHAHFSGPQFWIPMIGVWLLLFVPQR